MYKNKADLSRVRYIATQFYVLTLQKKSNGLSLSKIETTFKKTASQTKDEYRDKSSGVFHKYAKGGCRIKDKNLIEEIDKYKIYAGCNILLVHPVWLILENPEATLEQTRGYMRQLDPDTQSRLFKKNKKNGVLERKVWKTYEPFSWVGKNNNLDALACFLMLIREMELLKQWHSYANAKWYAHELFIRLSHFEPVSALADNIYSLIYHHFINKNQPITSSYFPKEKHRMFEVFKNEYASPSMIRDLEFFHILMQEMLSKARLLVLIGDSEKEELNFYFWLFEHNFKEVKNAFDKFDMGNEPPFIIKRLMTAITSSNTRKYIRRAGISDLSDPIMSNTTV